MNMCTHEKHWSYPLGQGATILLDTNYMYIHHIHVATKAKPKHKPYQQNIVNMKPLAPLYLLGVS